MAWTHRDVAQPDFKNPNGATFQVNPTVIGSTLYDFSSFGKVFALDAETGAGKRGVDSVLKPENTKGAPLRSRGLGYRIDPEASEGGEARGVPRKGPRSAVGSELSEHPVSVVLKTRLVFPTLAKVRSAQRICIPSSWARLAWCPTQSM